MRPDLRDAIGRESDMAAIIECIERIPSVMETVLDRQEEAFGEFTEYIKECV